MFTVACGNFRKRQGVRALLWPGTATLRGRRTATPLTKFYRSSFSSNVDAWNFAFLPVLKSALMSPLKKNLLAGCVAATFTFAVPQLFAADASATPPAQPLPAHSFSTLDGLDVTMWAQSPLLRNPTNIDIDKDGRIWVAEGVNYRKNYDRQPEGDRIVILEDTDGNGTADKVSVFVQEPFLRAPMGVAVMDNKIVVSMAPDIVVYTDVNRNLKFDPATDKRDVLISGFNGRIHDHTVHSVSAGPDGLWYWNAGNCGALFTDKSGKTFRIGSAYDPYYGKQNPGDLTWNPREIAGQKSDDGHVYIGGFAAKMRPDGAAVEIIGYNFRNSYEQAITSFGDVFQTDNDDPPACRTAFLLQYGNAGFCSFDGKRTWQADRRPGQDIATSEWRQEDPGAMPAGDVYGGGAPTGVAFYENGALGEKHQGLLLTCEPARNVVFGYYPKADGANFKLERFNFLTSNKEGEFAGTDFKGGTRSVTSELKTLFRPSDVCVGPDGAIYVADFFDPRVGGHQDLDETLAGAIYRVAPKGFRSKPAKLDLTSTKGQVEALKSPAVNLRFAGFTALKSQGGVAAISAVTPLLKDKNPYIRSRAIWLLSQLGKDGIARVEPFLKDSDPQFRIAAFRALRQQNHRLLENAKDLANDPSPAVRREVAVAMRDVSFAKSKDILATLAKGYDGKDRTYLEAFGTGCSGKESQMYDALLKTMGSADAAGWSEAFAGIAWRLHPKQAVDAFKQRALTESLSIPARKAALVALGYTPERTAAQAVIQVAAKTKGPVKEDAVWWLMNKKDNHWKEFGVMNALKEQGVYDPDKVELFALTVAEPPPSQLPPVKEILKLKGDANRGKQLATACYTCHRIGTEGVDYAPNLTAFAKAQTSEVVLNSIVNPSADIAHGYNGYEINTKDGLQIHGLILVDSDPVIIQSMGGQTQTVPVKRIQSKKPLNRSLMLSAEQMGLGPQELADLLAYLKSL